MQATLRQSGRLGNRTRPIVAFNSAFGFEVESGAIGFGNAHNDLLRARGKPGAR